MRSLSVRPSPTPQRRASMTRHYPPVTDAASRGVSPVDSGAGASLQASIAEASTAEDAAPKRRSLSAAPGRRSLPHGAAASPWGRAAQGSPLPAPFSRPGLLPRAKVAAPSWGNRHPEARESRTGLQKPGIPVDGFGDNLFSDWGKPHFTYVRLLFSPFSPQSSPSVIHSFLTLTCGLIA